MCPCGSHKQIPGLSRYINPEKPCEALERQKFVPFLVSIWRTRGEQRRDPSLDTITIHTPGHFHQRPRSSTQRVTLQVGRTTQVKLRTRMIIVLVISGDPSKLLSSATRGHEHWVDWSFLMGQHHLWLTRHGPHVLLLSPIRLMQEPIPHVFHY